MPCMLQEKRLNSETFGASGLVDPSRSRWRGGRGGRGGRGRGKDCSFEICCCYCGVGVVVAVVIVVLVLLLPLLCRWLPFSIW